MLKVSWTQDLDSRKKTIYIMKMRQQLPKLKKKVNQFIHKFTLPSTVGIF